MITTTKSYNLSGIMSRAWAIYRENTTDDLKAVFSICLQMAWAEAEAVYAEDNAAAVIAEWNDLGEAAQIRFMTACVRRAAKNEIGYSIEDKYLQFSEIPAWGLYGHAFDEFVNEAWLRIAASLDLNKLTARNEARAAQGKRPITLVSLVYNAARASIATIYNNDHKHGCASIRTIVGKDGEEYSYVDTMATSRRDCTETSAIIRADIDRFTAGRDAVDRAIIAGLMRGDTLREIAAVVNLSHVAVYKRVEKLRVALQVAIA